MFELCYLILKRVILMETAEKVLIGVVGVFLLLALFNFFGGDVTGSAVWKGWGGCSASNLCDVGEGDCDNDNECLAGLKCIDNVGRDYGYSKTADVCEGSIAKSIISQTAGKVSFKEVALGTIVSGSVTGVNERLDLSPLSSSVGNHVTVQTSLTSSEDDYQTDVVMEVARGSIKYIASYGSVGVANVLRHNINIKKFVSASILEVSIDGGPVQTIKDGDAFIGEDKNKPRWVWDIDTNLSSGLGVENDFIINDDTDSPLKVGDCINLPNKYSSICLNRLTVDDNNEYDTYTIGYDSNADLSDAQPGLTSVPTILITTAKTDGIKLSNGDLTEKVWVMGNGWAFYNNRHNSVEYLKWASIDDEDVGSINDDLQLAVALQENNIDVNINTGTNLKETISAKFVVRNEQVGALGGTNSYEEATELTWGAYGNPVSNIGTKDEDHRSAYGIIIRDPKAHGSVDEVVLDIPRRQVKAEVSMEIGGDVPAVPGYVSCIAESDCFLNVNEHTVVGGKTIKLERVGSAGAVVVDVEGITETISSGSTNIIDGMEVMNKRTFYDSTDPDRKSSAILIISEARSTTKGAVVCVKPDNTKGACISSVDENGRCECF